MCGPSLSPSLLLVCKKSHVCVCVFGCERKRHICVLALSIRVPFLWDVDVHAHSHPSHCALTPTDEHPGDDRPRKYYFLCLTKRSPQVTFIIFHSYFAFISASVISCAFLKVCTGMHRECVSRMGPSWVDPFHDIHSACFFNVRTSLFVLSLCLT